VIPLQLHEFHRRLDARFADLNGVETVNDYGDWPAEHAAWRETAGVIDLGFRSRLCLVGNDRVRFLHGQATNDVKRLRAGEGGYAALVTAKGRMESDLNIFCLPDELLLDFEPGLTEKVVQRLKKYIVADDVQIVDVAPHYGLLSVQGPKAEAVIRASGLPGWGESPDKPPRSSEEIGSRGRSPHQLPSQPFGSMKISDAALGEIYLINHPRLAGSAGILPAESQDKVVTTGRQDAGVPGTVGFDLFIPSASLAAVADKLLAAARSVGGLACGWQAFETARIEAGIPRFGADMDETNLPLECGIEEQAVSYKKGCYIGQEVINRVHSFGRVNKELRGLRLAGDLKALPQKGDKLFLDGKEIGCVTSAVKSPTLNAMVALGYVRREANQIGAELMLRTAAGEGRAKIVELPFVR